MIFYAIQTDNNDVMNDYISKCLNLLEKRDIIDERMTVQKNPFLRNPLNK
jgi:hypothetical protein